MAGQGDFPACFAKFLLGQLLMQDNLRKGFMMTKVFSVRHAQPEHSHEDDRTRPLTMKGTGDAKIVLETLQDKQIDTFYCSPYKRSISTIQETADYYRKNIQTDERFREREKGIDWMPYIVEMDFEGQELISILEHAHIEKEFKGNSHAVQIK